MYVVYSAHGAGPNGVDLLFGRPFPGSSLLLGYCWLLSNGREDPRQCQVPSSVPSKALCETNGFARLFLPLLGNSSNRTPHPTCDHIPARALV